MSLTAHRMRMLYGLWCKYFGGHDWRRSHVGETAGMRHCRRCDAVKPVKARAPKGKP